MPSSLFRYHENLGMVKKNITDIPEINLDLWSETEDEALINYYKSQKALLIEEITRQQKMLRDNNNILNQLEDQFQHLKEKYPEEFI